MKIVIETIDHKNQRYDTCGDWYWDKDTLRIFVSKMNDWRYEFLIAFHEEAEAMQCLQDGIDEKRITAFDDKFEKDRLKGLHSFEEEPGDHPDAPYRRQHFIATNAERILADALGVDWKKYEIACLDL